MNKNDAVILLESNPSDARLKIDTSGVVQTLKERMGTGGNNVPLVMVEEDEEDHDDREEIL